MLITWNKAFDRWEHAWAGYWTNFGLIILILICFIYILFILSNYCTNGNYKSNLMIVKVFLCFATMLIVIYGCMVIVALAGQASISTFCTVLKEINTPGTVNVLD